MERLTFEGDFCDIAMCQEMRGGTNCKDGACSQKKVWERLKQYEDAGLAPGWISVKERQPTVREDVLVLYANGRIAIDWIHFTGDYSFEEMYGRVTHWMPLLKPPEVEQYG